MIHLQTTTLMRVGLMLVFTVSGLLPLFAKQSVYASGGYPWNSAVCVSTGQASGKCPNYEWSYKGQVRNPTTGNYYYRNCTDYVAWRLIGLGVSASKVAALGNAGLWDNNATKKGLSVSTAPKAGTVGVDERYGHVVFVEKVSGSTITISEYNWGSTGSYGTRSGTKSQLGLSSFVDFGVKLGSNTPQPTINTTSKPTSVKGLRFLATDQLTVNQKLTANQYILSQNVRHVLVMQSDGNLVQYGDGFKSIWSSGTGGNPGAYAVLQADGNFVVYSKANKPLWASGVRAGAKRIILQHDANLVIYSSVNKPLWATNKVILDKSVYMKADRLKPGGQLRTNQYIRSADKRYVLMVQADGNLVAYAPGNREIWQTRTAGNPGARAVFQDDGNMVVYTSSNKPLWNIGINRSPERFIMQSDGNIAGYNTSNKPFWASATVDQL
jgi:surface antigen